MRPILRVDAQLCHTCSTCRARVACRTRAIVQFEHGDLPIVEQSRCLGCLVCIPACPFGAVRNGSEHSPAAVPAR